MSFYINIGLTKNIVSYFACGHDRHTDKIDKHSGELKDNYLQILEQLFYLKRNIAIYVHGILWTYYIVFVVNVISFVHFLDLAVNEPPFFVCKYTKVTIYCKNMFTYYILNTFLNANKLEHQHNVFYTLPYNFKTTVINIGH